MSATWRFMLDTDTVSYVLRDVGATARNLTAHQPSEICISALTLAELRFGADKRRSKRLHTIINAFVASVGVAPFDASAAAAFGRAQASLESKGTPIGTIAALIAAHALALNLVLVTNNTKHFAHVRGLKMENWSK